MVEQTKLKKLIEILKDMESVVIAFSGGVDSSFLCKVAYETLGKKALAITAASETYTRSELEEATEFARRLGIPHQVIHTEELANPDFVNNPPDRCYYCKKELFGKLWSLARSQGLNQVIDGANADDIGDFRPGLLAGRELGVRSPLREAGLTKKEIRALSRQMGLPTWDKPALACLSSRFPYGDPITMEKLQQVQAAEDFLKEKGFSQFRVRHHGAIARIEVPADQIPLLTANSLRQEILAFLQNLGFTYITLDLAGFSSGSMNLVLPEEVKNGYRPS